MESRQSSSNAPQWNEKAFSISVNKVLKTLGDSDVNLNDILVAFYDIHPEYPIAGFVNHPDIVKIGINTDTAHWASQVQRIIIQQPNNIISGREFIVGCALLYYDNEMITWGTERKKFAAAIYTLVKALLDELDATLHRSPEQLFTELGTKLYDNFLTDYTSQNGNGNSTTKDDNPNDLSSSIGTNNLSDSPTDNDTLSRRPLAAYLARRLRHIYHKSVDTDNRSAFFMHLDGAWGSGKSTVLRYLKKALEDPKQKNASIKADKPWIVVDFNAWETQRLDPPWWYIMKAVHDTMYTALKKRNPLQAVGLQLRELGWRLNTGTNYLVAAAITFLVVGIQMLMNSNSTTAQTPNDIKTLPLLGSISTLVAFAWSLTSYIRSGLVSGSGRAAQQFIEQNGKDPMRVLAKHFSKQVSYCDYPVAIFIDDLDRCNQEYGVKLLEGLQTIFRNAPVVYVVSADKRWISTMYEKQYEMFAPVISKPAKPFGIVFLDKTFQMVVSLPDISAKQKQEYWTDLLTSSGRKEIAADVEVKIKESVKNTANNEEKMKLVDQDTLDAAAEQLMREEVISNISIGEEDTSIRHELLEFVNMVEPNPRAMKRLINDIGTATALTFLYSQKINQDQLILWCILKNQYPQLADTFWADPDMIDRINMAENGTLTTDVEQLKTFLQIKEIAHFIALSRNHKEIKLDSGFIRKLKSEFNEKVV